MAFNKDVVMQKVQRFGGAMFTPVLMFGVFGIIVALSILCKNPMILGSIAEKGTAWYNFWYIIEQGAWTVFNQLPLLFVIGLPIGLAKKNNARACMEAFLIYIIFNYFVQAMLTLWGPSFGVDFSKEAVAGSGLAMVANIKTLDTGMIGAIVIASLAVYLHGKLFDVNLPDYLGLFKGSSLVVVAGFVLMLPVAYLFCLIWPQFQAGIASLQYFLTSAGVFGVWLYTFLERILIPTGLHHFIYIPFIFGPAVVDGGIQAYWLQHIQEFAQSTKPLIELFPQGGFALHGMSKIFGCPGIALAIYFTAKPERRKKVAAILIPAVITAVLCGITEPLEFTFLFIAPVLFLIHALLAGTLAATMYFFGVTGNFGGGILDCATRLRVTVKDDSLVKDTNVFMAAGAHGLVHNGCAIQVIVGLSVPQVRERFEALLQGPDVLQKEELVSNTDKSPSLKAFATGDLVSIENVPDEAFASRAMGDGVAIIPTEKYITAPANGSVMMIMEETGHALGLKLDTDMEILIHIGIDTVNMKGDGFKVLVKAGDEVKVGDKLVEIDIEKIKKAGYNPITIMIATNFDQYSLLKFEKEQKVIAGKTTVGTY
jgi:alpha-glucoside-specific phosphotransferase system IIBC component/glucose-specific phosphotransferase system IIA component